MILQAKSSRALSNALAVVVKCISSKNSMAILNNVLLTRNDNGSFMFTASNGDSQLTIPAPLEIVRGDMKHPVAIHVAGIISYLSLMPDCVVNLTFADNNLTIDYCTSTNEKDKVGKVQFPFVDGSEFPLMHGLNQAEVTHICLPGAALRDAISVAPSFVAADELRPAMNCLCIDIANDMSQCNLVATNGRTLVKFIHSNDPKTGGSDFYRSGKPVAMMIHSAYFKPLSPLATCQSVDIEYDGGTLRFASEHMEFICKAVEGRYPNYESVIPKSRAGFVCFDKKEILSVIKRVSIFGSDTSKLICVKKDGMFLDVFAKDIDFATSAQDQVFIANSECEDGFAIGFNSQHFVDALNAIPSDTVCLSLLGPDKSVTLVADGAISNVLTLVMPMLLSE